MSALLDTPVDLTPDELLTDLASRGVTVTRVGTDLRFSGPVGLLPDELKSAIRDQAVGLFAIMNGFPPIDEVIARSESTKRTVDEIQARIDQSRQMVAAHPTWPPYGDAVGYWTAILAIKQTGIGLDDTPEDDQYDEEEAQ